MHVENKTLRAINLLFDSNSFQSFLCDGKCISFQFYWFIKGLFFYIFCCSFAKYLWFKATFAAYWKQLFSSLFFEFTVAFFLLSNQENLDPLGFKLILVDL